MRQVLHFKKCPFLKDGLCNCEIRGYGYLAAVTLVASLLEFGVAQFLAKSSSVKTDSLHAGIHSSWYGLAVTVSWLVNRFSFAKNHENKLRALFGLLNFVMLFISLGLIVWRDAVPKWQNNFPVNAYLMLVGGMLGLVGNWLQLGILKRIKLIILQQAEKLHETFEWSKTDVFSDLWLSVAVVLTACYLITARLLGFTPWFRIDPLLTFIAIFWIGYIAFDLLIRKAAKNL